MPTIKDRFLIHVDFSPMHRGYLITILLGEEIYLNNYLLPEHVCFLDKIHPFTWAREWLREHVLKEWPTCHEMNTSEPTFPLTKKVLVASCGKLVLQETLKQEQQL